MRRTKQIFILAAFIAVVLLLAVYLGLKASPPIESYGDGISFYGVVVDIIVGAFTLFGLYLAVSEFAEARIKPDLGLVIGAPPAKSTRRPLDKNRLQGQDNISSGYDRTPVSQIVFGLQLENNSRRAAQFVQIALHLKGAQKPLKFEVVEDSFRYYKPQMNILKQDAVTLQFGEDLVVYKGDGVYLGEICAEWEKATRPEKIVLEAEIYNLVGDPKTVIISRPISWNNS